MLLTLFPHPTAMEGGILGRCPNLVAGKAPYYRDPSSICEGRASHVG